MPAMIDALSGQPLKQNITIDMSDAARFGKQQSDELRKSLLCSVSVKEPTSYDAGRKIRSNVIIGLKA